MKRLAKRLALFQDGDPRKSGLESIENKFFKQRTVVQFRHAPFLVVVRDINRINSTPPAALLYLLHEIVRIIEMIVWVESVSTKDGICTLTLLH